MIYFIFTLLLLALYPVPHVGICHMSPSDCRGVVCTIAMSWRDGHSRQRLRS